MSSTVMAALAPPLAAGGLHRWSSALADPRPPEGGTPTAPASSESFRRFLIESAHLRADRSRRAARQHRGRMWHDTVALRGRGAIRRGSFGGRFAVDLQAALGQLPEEPCVARPGLYVEHEHTVSLRIGDVILQQRGDGALTKSSASVMSTSRLPPPKSATVANSSNTERGSASAPTKARQENSPSSCDNIAARKALTHLALQKRARRQKTTQTGRAGYFAGLAR